MSDESLILIIILLTIYYIYSRCNSRSPFEGPTDRWIGNDPDLTVMTDYMADGGSMGMTRRSFQRYGGDSLLQLNYILKNKHKDTFF